MAYQRLVLGSVVSTMMLSQAHAATQTSLTKTDAMAKRPNVVVILADDLGYTDIAPYGSEIKTPNLDALAAQGVKFSNFQVTPFSGPSRAAFLTGTDPHMVGMGTMDELLTPEQRKGNPQTYAGMLTNNAYTIAERLQDSGYRTIIAGKWHQGVTDAQTPEKFGFDRSLVLLRGEDYHFKSPTLDEQGRQTTFGVYHDPNGLTVYRQNGKPYNVPNDFYSSKNYTDFMINEINQRPSNQPFFGYLAFTAPHSPLQAPEEDIARQAGKYMDGPEALAKRRLAAQKRLGLTAPNTAPHPMVKINDWNTLTDEQKQLSAKRMQLHAAMIENMDANIGRLIANLKARGEYDNTLFFFLSDNGAAGNMRETSKRWGKWVTQTHDNRLENIGKPSSYTSLTPEWAQASSTPFYLFKGYTSEGGIRSPLIVSGPGVAKHKIEGRHSDITDLTPTILALTGTPNLTPDGKTPITGYSFDNYLKKPSAKWAGPTVPRTLEMSGNKVVKLGNYKARSTGHYENFLGLPNKMLVVDQWQLFDLSKDPGETRDLAKTKPDVLASLVAQYDSYSKDKGVVDISPAMIK